MDERKRPFRAILKLTSYLTLTCFLIVGGYGSFVYFQLQSIKNPKKCMTTEMYKVHLCPSNPNYTRYSVMPKHFFQALILSEDASFWSHKGFDWFEIKESFRRNFVEWKFARGGSTLTQQLAKNLYLSQEKSLDRKFKEFFIAKEIEKKLSKAQILEKYINVVEFGSNIFGIKRAAEHYFYKTPENLNILESIYLVSLLPSPKRLGRSFENQKLSRNNIWRMKIILKRLYRTNRIEDELFVYLEMLIDESDWPFNNYSNEMFDDSSLVDQIFNEFEDMNEDSNQEEESEGNSSIEEEELTNGSSNPEEPGENDQDSKETEEQNETTEETLPTEAPDQSPEIDREIQSLDN